MEEIRRDLVIVGAGAAGLSAAIYGCRGGLSVTLLEQGALGGQALQIDNLENYPFITDKVDGFSFAMNLESQAKKFGTQIEYEAVESIKKENNLFVTKCADKVYLSKSLIIATGAAHNTLNVPGEEAFKGRGVSYCATCDGPFFKNKKILVVGGGDSACDEALFLSKLSDKITIVHRKERFRAQKAVADRVLNNANIEVRFSSQIKEIKGDKSVSSVVIEKSDGTSYEEEFAAVFIFVGMNPQSALVENLVELDASRYIKTDETMQSSCKGLFAAGDVRTTPFRQVVTACSDGAVAAHYAISYIDEIENKSYC